jgi:nitrate reductase gamma subunit
MPVLAAEKTRPEFWGFGTEIKILWYLLAAASVVVFFWGVAREVAKYRRGHGDDLPPRRELWPRFVSGTRTLFSHESIKRRSPYVGWAHRGIFYGWIVLFAGTIILAINSDFTEPVFGWRFFQGNFYLVYSIILDILGVALIAGLAMMMVRRGIMRPRPRLDYDRPDRAPGDPQYDRNVYRRGDWIFLGLLLYLAITGYLLEGVRISMDAPGYNVFSPVGWVFAQLFDLFGLSDGTLGVIRRVIWWTHGLVAIAFVAAIPYTKATHMIESWAGLILKDPKAGKRLRSIPDDRADQPAGYATLDYFWVTPLWLLDACT